MRLDTYKEKKFHEQFEPPVCAGCGKTIAEQELSDVEYVRTKRIFSFTGIVKIKFGDKEDEANVDRKKSNGCPAGVY